MTSLRANIGSEHEDDEQPIIGVSNEKFHPLRTISVFSFHTLVSTIITVIGIFLALLWKDEDRCKAYFIMLYLRVAFWFISLICNHIAKVFHDKLRLNGHHEFFRSIAVHKEVPFLIVSLWNTALLGIQALMHHFYGDDFGKHCIETLLSPIVYITAFSGVESLILYIVNGSYIAKVCKFNKESPLPDALVGSGTPETGSIGFMQPGSDTTELLEKQADLIHYLKERNHKLNEEVMKAHAIINRMIERSHESSVARPT